MSGVMAPRWLNGQHACLVFGKFKSRAGQILHSTYVEGIGPANSFHAWWWCCSEGWGVEKLHGAPEVKMEEVVPEMARWRGSDAG